MTLLRRWSGALLLSVSFFSIARVRPPAAERDTAARAMLLAPLVGAALGGAAGLVGLAAKALGLPPLPAAVLSVGTLAALTRALHLDGLADLADGLGSGKPAGQALEVMRRSDIGPFGVVVVVLTLLLQVAAVAELVADGSAVVALVIAAAAGRTAVPMACRPGVRAARPGGLGALVAGAVPLPLGLAAVLATVGTAGALGLIVLGPVVAVAAVCAALAASSLLQLHAHRRLCGITGDVFGALIETGMTVCLLVLAVGASTPA